LLLIHELLGTFEILGHYAVHHLGLKRYERIGPTGSSSCTTTILTTPPSGELR